MARFEHPNLLRLDMAYGADRNGREKAARGAGRKGTLRESRETHMKNVSIGLVSAMFSKEGIQRSYLVPRIQGKTKKKEAINRVPEGVC